MVRGWVGEDILDTYTTERHLVAARLPQNTRAQIGLMRPDPQTRRWGMFSDLMDPGDDHRLLGTLCPDMKLTLERPETDVVIAVTRSADLLRESRRLLLDSAALMVVSDSLGRKQASDERCDPYVGG